ncbi:AtpZ/AtpI family protein [Kordiimonas sp. SCSIO 12610]|uniref:AtpZ/AtpI family protein n=1 Tax=Kordiimonas sp. SCSIO 12610 TaxID=2829597 RepID=UPI00210DC5CB|nr:AtpZ/AtpI family protein [Kordiimonas sp. SCSIO 12610]UTW54497.1 AtpZ/AtpI family protein [Kordiimonas sp. SCSIO 12610]
MADNKKPSDLLDLEERLKKARKSAHPEEDVDVEQQQRSEAMGIAFKMGVELVVGTAIGGLIGWALDDVFGSKPWLLIVFLVLGFAAGMMNVVRDANKSQQDEE